MKAGNLKQLSLMPWLCVRGFNENTEQSKKFGATIRLERQMEAFINVLEDCQLSDLGFMGAIFTWCNN